MLSSSVTMMPISSTTLKLGNIVMVTHTHTKTQQGKSTPRLPTGFPVTVAKCILVRPPGDWRLD